MNREWMRGRGWRRERERMVVVVVTVVVLVDCGWWWTVDSRRRAVQVSLYRHVWRRASGGMALIRILSLVRMVVFSEWASIPKHKQAGRRTRETQNPGPTKGRRRRRMVGAELE